MNTMTESQQLGLSRPEITLDPPDFSALNKSLPKSHSESIGYRLYHLTEIGNGKAVTYRLAMANVISVLNHTDCSALYCLSGNKNGIELYIGVTSHKQEADVHETGISLCAAFEGNFLGAKLTPVPNDSSQLDELLKASNHLGLITGVPSYNEDESAQGDEDFQGIDRLANSLIGETWQLLVVAEPGTDQEIRKTLEQILDFSTELSAYVKQSVQHATNTGSQKTVAEGTSSGRSEGKSTSDALNKSKSASSNSNASTGSTTSGSSTSKGTATSDTSSQTRTLSTNENNTVGSNSSKTNGTSGGESHTLSVERIDKRYEEMQRHLSEILLERFRQGRSKGMFRTAVYASAKKKAVFNRLTSGILSIFQGNRAAMTPLRVHKIQSKGNIDLAELFSSKHWPCKKQDCRRALAHSIPFNDQQNALESATWLNTQELSLIAGLPSMELPGLKIRKSVAFALNTSEIRGDGTLLKLGKIIQHGRLLPNKSVNLPCSELSRHVFITGVTGAGKTTTCMKILLESKLPFLVIEPAKTEYRALYKLDNGIEYYTLGREDLTPFRLNPFELVSNKENLASHIATLNATMAAAFPMEAAMPFIVEEAIINAYKQKGWDIHSGVNFFADDPFADGANAWPTFSDMITELDNVIKSKRMGKEFEDKYRGSLVARFTNLTVGTKGRMLNTRHSLDFDQLLDKRVVIELDELKDEQDKALFMGLIISRLAECMKHRHSLQPSFQHLTLIEEAHRLLSKPEPGDAGAKRMGVNMFANLLAEVRKYGEGLIIADQIPNKLVSDVIKNTNIKIVHRLFAADDRNTIGDAMGLSDEQKDFLPLLQPGETVIYCGGWHAPVLVKIDEDTKTSGGDIPEKKFKQQGRKPLWEQRKRLLPKLSAQPKMVDKDVLADFLYDGGIMLNMALRIAMLGIEEETLQDRTNIQTRYLGRYQKWSERLDVPLPAISVLLTALLMDCAIIPLCSAGDLKSYEALLPPVFYNLAVSLEQFTKGKDIISNSPLHMLDSI